MSKATGIKVGTFIEWHAKGVVSDYDTLCGLDANDPGINTYGHTSPTKGQKITCPECKTIWLNMKALKLRSSDFE